MRKLIPRGLKKEQKEELASTEALLAWLQAGKDVRLNREWSVNDVEVINQHQLLTAKPCVFLINLSEEDYKRKKNKWLGKIAQWVTEHGGEPIIPFSAAFEKKLVDMPDDEAAAYQKDNEIVTCLPKIIKTGFKAIQVGGGAGRGGCPFCPPSHAAPCPSSPARPPARPRHS